jgi:hypothetical protein
MPLTSVHVGEMKRQKVFNSNRYKLIVEELKNFMFIHTHTHAHPNTRKKSTLTQIFSLMSQRLESFI